MNSLLPQPPGSRPTRGWWTRTLLLNAMVVLAVFGAIQLIPVSRANPPTVREPVWDSPATRDLAVRACYDCHSNETAWPWYTTIAPSSWVAWYDVTEGRQALNFSDWDRHADDEWVDPADAFPPPTLSERIEREIRDGTMPPGSYRLFNPAARLSEAEREALIAGLVVTTRQNQTPPPVSP